MTTRTGAITEEQPEESVEAKAAPAGPRSAEAGRQTPRGKGGAVMTQHLNRYLEVLGLRPGVSLDEINTTYYTLVKRSPQNPTEEDEKRLQELKRAYDMLRRGYVPPQKKTLQVLFDRRLMVPVLAVLTVVMAVAFVALNWNTIQLKMTHYEKGDVVRLKAESVPYGEIVAYDDHHQFPMGNPSAAYAIRLDRSQDIVWVGERTVVNGMARAR
jgi:hypothetical protein